MLAAIISDNNRIELSWVMLEADRVLSSKPIADNFASQFPTGITSITPPAGTTIRVGEVNPNFGGVGGATQFELLKLELIEGWADVTPIK
jgi:hypothetical protein